MIHIFERYLEKKLRVAELLYLSNGEFSKNNAQKELSISLSTLTQYSNEMEQLYKHYYQSGMLYNTTSLRKISTELIGESNKIQLLKLLFLYPGHLATFYKEQLLISDASFSRLIAQLKEDLNFFDTKIIIRQGYRVEAKSEFYTCMLIAHIASKYNWSVNEFEERLIEVDGERELEELKKLDVKEFMYVDNKLEKEFFQFNLLISLIRMKIREQEKLTTNKQLITAVEDLENFLIFKQVFQESEDIVSQSFKQIVENGYPNGLLYERRERLKKLLVCTVFHIKLFPYELDNMPLRQVFFVNKFKKNYPEKVEEIDNFILYVGRILRIDITYRYPGFFYCLVSEELFNIEKVCQMNIYIHSSLGKPQEEYLYQQLKGLTAFFDEYCNIRILPEGSDSYLTSNDLALTSEYLSNFLPNNQYILSDYLSMQDFVYVGIWIRKRMTNLSE